MKPYGGHPEFGQRVVLNDNMPSLAGWESLAKDALLAWEAERAAADKWFRIALTLRTFASHFPSCEYSPAYPDTGGNCTCDFDVVLREMDE